MKDFLFTSESVSCGHPDKLADQISDVVLDAIIAIDPKAKVACETYIKTGLVLVGGEITTSAWIDIEQLIRNKLVSIGYDNPNVGLDGNSCAVLNAIGRQSPEIANGINNNKEQSSLGAGDQGIVYGYACNETDSLMPAPIYYAHKLMQQQRKMRQNNSIPWLGPDAKVQITFKYTNDIPIYIDNIVFSAQHSPGATNSIITESVIEEIIKPIIPHNVLSNCRYIINPSGSFILGGPSADCGLTGRKIIVDTYGGMCKHGGGAFSGKDPSKIDRSAAYYARYIAKHVVAAKLASRCEVQLSYAIGLAEPTSLQINTFETNAVPNSEILDIVKSNFNPQPENIISELDLLRPIYTDTATYGHFGREEKNFTWEQLNKQIY